MPLAEPPLIVHAMPPHRRSSSLCSMVLYIAVGVLGALTVPQSHEVRHFYAASNRC